MLNKSVAIVGTVGVPSNYGGFETLAENLVRYHYRAERQEIVTVYCSSKSYSEREKEYLSSHLKYIPLNANGAQSIPYDMLSLLSAIWNRSDVILLLGVSGAMILPLVRLISSTRIITNIDGIEWRRQKWQGLAKWVLKFSEKMAVRFSHAVIADNDAITEYVKAQYGVKACTIAYGGEHAMNVDALSVNEYALPNSYAFSVCRIEPENNITMILETFANQTRIPLVLVGNWDSSHYGRCLRQCYGSYGHIFLLNPIYELGKLKALREGASVFVHGHSAGGTNPSLVEAMHFGKPVMAFDCNFNRATTEDKALYFHNEHALRGLIESADMERNRIIGEDMQEIAKRRYTWDMIAKEYFSLIVNT